MGLSHSSSMRRMDDWERSPKSPNRLPSLLVDRPKPGVRQMELLKQNPELIRFYIRQKFGQDIPVNSKLESYQQGDDQHHKIEKYLKGKSKADGDGVHLAHLYTDDLREREDARFVRASDKTTQPQSETRQRITELLSATGKYKL